MFELSYMMNGENLQQQNNRFDENKCWLNIELIRCAFVFTIDK